MSPLSSEYSRNSFETAEDVPSLCRRLADDLTSRVREAPSAAAEMAKVVSELRSIGHQLHLWDSDGEECEIWGGDYVNPESSRLIVHLYHGEAGAPWVSVSFGPWPVRKPNPACQQCKREMTPTTLRLGGRGHGQVDAPSIRINLCLGEAEPIAANCGVRSIGLQIPAMWCPECNALWIPDVRAIGWTG